MTWQVPNLYALAAYDMGEFLDVLNDVDDKVLEELYTTLTFLCKKHSKETKELNKLAAGFVHNKLLHRDLKVINGKALLKKSQTPQNPEYRFQHLSEKSVG